MSELKKIRVRKAKERDIGLFRKLWGQLLEQNTEQGSIIVPNSNLLSLSEEYFNLYVNNIYEGIVLFVADKGVLMWGETNSLLEYKPGNLVVGWGFYVVPDSSDEIEKALFSYAENWAREKGYDGVQTQYYNKPLEGFTSWTTFAYKVFDQ